MPQPGRTQGVERRVSLDGRRLNPLVYMLGRVLGECRETQQRERDPYQAGGEQTDHCSHQVPFSRPSFASDPLCVKKTASATKRIPTPRKRMFKGSVKEVWITFLKK